MSCGKMRAAGKCGGRNHKDMHVHPCSWRTQTSQPMLYLPVPAAGAPWPSAAAGGEPPSRPPALPPLPTRRPPSAEPCSGWPAGCLALRDRCSCPGPWSRLWTHRASGHPRKQHRPALYIRRWSSCSDPMCWIRAWRARSEPAKLAPSLHSVNAARCGARAPSPGQIRVELRKHGGEDGWTAEMTRGR